MGWGEVDRDRDNQEQLDRQTGIDRPREQSEWLGSHYQTYRSEDSRVSSQPMSWSERIRGDQQGAQGPSSTTSPSGRGRGLVSILFALFFIYAFFHAQFAVAGTLDGALAKTDWETTRHFSLELLKLFGRVFLPVSSLAVAVITFFALGRGFFGFFRMMLKGSIGIAIGGLLIFFGTFLYLIVVGAVGG